MKIKTIIQADRSQMDVGVGMNSANVGVELMALKSRYCSVGCIRLKTAARSAIIQEDSAWMDHG
jgi:hypothetical protein